MIINNKELSTYRLFISLNVVVVLLAITTVLSLLMPESGIERVGNIIILSTILLSFLFYGKFKFTPLRGLLFFFCFILYISRPGIFSIGVPLVPLIGLFLTTKQHNFDLFKKEFMKRAKIISIVFFFLVYLMLYWYSFSAREGSANQVSIVAIYFIVLNMIFFREPFIITVLFAFVLSSLFTPGLVSYGETPTFGVPNTHQGNRSAVFLLLFLFTIKNIKGIYAFFIKKKYFVWFILSIIPITIFVFSIVSDFLQRDKMMDVFSDPRFEWFIPMFQLIINEGFTSFFNNGSDMLYTLGDGRRNPHNSFLYLLLEQYWLGLFKILIFISSIFALPLSTFLAITFRASLDIFLLLGAQDIFIVVLISEFYNFKFKKQYNLIGLKNQAKL